MDTNNTNNNKVNYVSPKCSSHTDLPKWQATSPSDRSVTPCSRRKLYTLLVGWAIVMGVAVAASWRDGKISADTRTENTGNVLPEAFRLAASDNPSPKVTLRNELQNSLPHHFHNTRSNEINSPELLKTAAYILAIKERPLRVLQIGDSHVAGRTFPNAVKKTLTHYLGKATAPDSSTGVWFSYVGSNGATTKRFLTESYLRKFAEATPDLIILSLGTNEAHGMGYRESQHKKELNVFLDKLRRACPDAVVLITTPPGDYLKRSYVNYRRTSHSRRRVRQVRYSHSPNPMSARCANLLTAYGKEHGMPVWNLFDICGGEAAAQRNWVSAHYMRPDRIHFQPNGYELHGKLLGEALVKALAEQL